MSLEINPEYIIFENFLPQLRQEKRDEQSSISVVPFIDTCTTVKKTKILSKVILSNEIYHDTKKLTEIIAKAIVKELTPEEEEATAELKNIKLSDNDQSLLMQKTSKERHEYLIQKILLNAFEKTNNCELALKNGLAEIKEYCRRLVELSQRVRGISKRKHPVPMQTQSQPMEDIQSQQEPIKEKRKIPPKEMAEKEVLKKPLIESKTVKRLLASFTEISEKRETLHSFIQQRYPTRDISALHDEQYHEIVQDYKDLYSHVESLMPFMSAPQQNSLLEILNSDLPFEKIENEIFKLLLEAVKTHFTSKPPQDEPYRPLRPLIEKTFPRAALLSFYFHHFDSLYETYQDIDKFCEKEFEKIKGKGLTKDEFRKFVLKQFDNLSHSQFLPENLIRAQQELGRLMFLIDHKPAVVAQYIQNPNPNFISTEFPKIDRPSDIFSINDINQDLNIAAFEVRPLDVLSSALVRQDGTINCWLIHDAKLWVKDQIRPKNISLAHHLNKVLNEIEYNENISKLLTDNKYNERVESLGKFLQDPTFNIEGSQLVQAACHLVPSQPISLVHINKAIITSLLSPWRQHYFGSCHTTGLIIAIKSASTEAVIKDLQDIILTGSLIRLIDNQPIAFRAPFSLYPVLQAGLRLQEFAINKDQLVERLFKESSLQQAWTLLQPTPEKTLKGFLEEFLKAHSDFKKNPFTLQDIIIAMKPALMGQEEFDLCLKFFNSNYQDPLLQCFQNGIMGIQHVPFNLAKSPYDLVSCIFKIELMDFLNFCAEKCNVENKLFRLDSLLPNYNTLPMTISNPQLGRVLDEKFQGLYNKSPTLQTLRFIATPPPSPQQKKFLGGTLTLAICDSQNHFKPVNNENEFFDLVIKIFNEITGKSESGQSLGNVHEICKQTMDARSALLFGMPKADLAPELHPWTNSACAVFAPGSHQTPFFSTYFQTSEMTEMDQITVGEDYDMGVTRFREWALKQKQKIPLLKKLKIPARTNTFGAYYHDLNVIFDDDKLTGAYDSEVWRKEREKSLTSFMKEDNERVLLPIVGKAIAYLDQRGENEAEFKAYFEKNKKDFSLKENETFWQWYKRIGTKLSTEYSATVDKNQPYLSVIERLEHFVVFQEIILANPQLRQELIFTCGDGNTTDFDPISKKICNQYYAFALIPSYSGTPKWTSITTLGKSVQGYGPLRNFNVRRDPDFLIKQFKNQNLIMPKGYCALTLLRLQNEFITCWKRQTSQGNTKDLRPKLKKLKTLFQNAVNELRQDNKLAFSDELFITMYKNANQPDSAFEALLERGHEKIDALVQSDVQSCVPCA